MMLLSLFVAVALAAPPPTPSPTPVHMDECVPDVPCEIGFQAVAGCGFINSDENHCHVIPNGDNCTLFDLPDCCMCAEDPPPPTPQPTPKVTPVTDEDCNTTDSIEVFQKTQCAVHRDPFEKGKYEFWIAMALPEDNIAVIIDFGDYVDIRNRGTCDNRLDEVNETMYTWPTLFDEDLYGTNRSTNSWLKVDGNITSISNTTYPYPSWHQGFYGPDLLLCQSNNMTDLVAFGMDIGNTTFIYSGSIFAHAVFPMDIDNETAGEMFKYSKECAFTITMGPKTGTVAITYLAINIDFHARWVKSICDKNNDLHVIIETCIDDFAALSNINQFAPPADPNSTFSVEVFEGDMVSEGNTSLVLGTAQVTIIPTDSQLCFWVTWDDTQPEATNVTVVIVAPGGNDLTTELNITNGNELDGCIDCATTALNCTQMLASLRAGIADIFAIRDGDNVGASNIQPPAPACDFTVEAGKCCQQWDIFHANTLDEAPLYDVLDLAWDVTDGAGGEVFPDTEVQAWVTIDIESPCFEEISTSDDLVVMCEFYTDINFTSPYLFNGTQFEATNVTQVLFDCEPIYLQCDIMLDDDAYCDFFQLDITELIICDANLSSYNASEPIDAPYDCVAGTETIIFNGTGSFNYTELDRRLGGTNVSSECCINSRSCWDIHKNSDLPQIALVTYEISMKPQAKKKRDVGDYSTQTISKKRTILLPNADPNDSIHDLHHLLPFEISCQPEHVFSPAAMMCVAEGGGSALNLGFTQWI